MKRIKISTEYITLGQFLKLADVIDTGGAVKSRIVAMSF
ncbi:RNA-binding S4 domain-containing protein, partial [Bacillus sp. MHSD17]|nr:RNA-binding S4 domain-containing protein [Bacillus sp. MHSD17]